MNHRFPFISWLFFTWLIWGPIIINSQPGTTFFVLGIDWKADNLDNTMFWLGIILIILGATSETYKEQKQDKREEKRWQNEKRDNNLR